MPIPTPVLPFPGFKWKWASNEPTEGLNEPSVFLGVLRALLECEGFAPSSARLQEKLAAVESGTQTGVDLVRSRDRNLIRNSGQYWKAKGLLIPIDGKIALTPFGREVALGTITRAEFAASVIQNYELPNRTVFSSAMFSQWVGAKIKIKPLQLILNIVSSLFNNHGSGQACITAGELGKITVPLSVISSDPHLHADALHKFRRSPLDFNAWPNCMPAANDLRILREFLIFLNLFGYLELEPDHAQNRDKKYFLPEGLASTIETFVKTVVPATAPYEGIVTEVRKTGIISGVERRRVQRTVAERLGQAKFRRDVIAKSGCRCLLTEERIADVLEAAHIFPVEKTGSDEGENGLCLRADIHILFDSSHIRIKENGEIILTPFAATSPIYRELPKKIALPAYINADALKWRFSYL